MNSEEMFKLLEEREKYMREKQRENMLIEEENQFDENGMPVCPKKILTKQ
jgi:hypothetical protein